MALTASDRKQPDVQGGPVGIKAGILGCNKHASSDDAMVVILPGLELITLVPSFAQCRDLRQCCSHRTTVHHGEQTTPFQGDSA